MMSNNVKNKLNKIIMENDTPEEPAAVPRAPASRAKNMEVALEVVANTEKMKALYLEKISTLEKMAHLIFLRALWPVELPKDAKMSSRWVISGNSMWLEISVNGEWKKFALKDLPPQMLPDRPKLEELMRKQEYSHGVLKRVKDLRTAAGLSF